MFHFHENNTRPHEGWNIKTRLARHYYDVAALIRAGYVDKELFFDVRDKRKLYHWQTWVDYDTLLPSDLKLIPDALELRENGKGTTNRLQPCSLMNRSLLIH